MEKITQKKAVEALTNGEWRGVLLGAQMVDAENDFVLDAVKGYILDAIEAHGEKAFSDCPIRTGTQKSYGVDFRYTGESGERHTSRLAVKGCTFYFGLVCGYNVVVALSTYYSKWTEQNTTTICAYIQA